MADTTENIAESLSGITTFSTSADTRKGVAAPYTLDTYRKNIYAEQESIWSQPYSNMEIFEESAKNMFRDTTLGVAQRYSDVYFARKTTDNSGKPINNPLLTRDEANVKYAKYGVTFSGPVRQNEAEVIAAQKIREYGARARLDQNEGTFLSGASSLMGSFAGSLADPINIATAFIPVTKIMPALRGLEAMGAAGRVAVRGIDGVIMNSLVEPLPLAMAGVDQRDYTMADSLFSLTAGGLFGAGIGGFAEGVRCLGKGERFNSNLAASIDFANNNGLDNIKEFQAKRNTVTSFAYDDLVNLNESHVLVQEVDGKKFVKLNESGPLSKLTGYGDTVEEAVTHLRKQIGAEFDNPAIINGYRLDDGIDNFYKALNESGNLADATWLPKWLDNVNKKAMKKGLSFEEYIATNSKNFTDFSKLVRRAEQSKAMQIRFGELSGDALDDMMEKGAEVFDAYISIKEAFKNNPRQLQNYKTYITDLRSKTFEQKQLLNTHMEMEASLNARREELNGLKQQLDMSEVTSDRDLLASQINELETSIKAQESDFNNFAKSLDKEAWKADADNIALLENMRRTLEADPRTFDDVRQQLESQIRNEDGKTWDTSDSILDDMNFADEPIADEARISKLTEDAQIFSDEIKTLTQDFDEEDFARCGLDNQGRTKDMVALDRRIEEMNELKEDAAHFAECRRGEIL